LTQQNLFKLSQLPFVFLHPTEEGKLACGDFGQGKLPAIDKILDLAPFVRPQKASNPLKVVITTGATLSPLDPVRYMTNPASGLTGLYFAQSFLSDGHEVILIAGKNSTERLEALKAVPYCKLLRVTTPKDMELSVMSHIAGADIFIASAAVGDIEFEASSHKIKKESLDSGVLHYKKTTDILKKVLEEKHIIAPHLKTVGFAAETNPCEAIFREKWLRKPVDLLVGNGVNNGMLGPDQAMQGFGTSSNHYYFVKEGKIIEDKELTKTQLAQEIKEQIYDRTLHHS
jgi:phosphopantothenoylcysteine decarboxylase/phosphopantothenate--cysteine ligase